MTVESIFNPNLFGGFCKELEAVRAADIAPGFLDPIATTVKDCAPVLAFHCAPSPEVLQSIAKTGLLAPLDVIPTTGETLGVSHGAAWGQGIYLSPRLDFSSNYGFQDADGTRQALLCLVCMGRNAQLRKNVDPTPSLT